MNLVQSVAPAELPVTLPEAKEYARVTHNDHDDEFNRLIGSATAYFDGWNGVLGRALVTQTWEMTISGFDCLRKLPLSPVQSVTGISYFDSDNQSQSFTDFRLTGDIVEAVESYPSTYFRSDAVQVTFVAGYGDGADVPEDIRGAILCAVRADYSGDEWPEAIQRTVHKYRRPRF